MLGVIVLGTLRGIVAAIVLSMVNLLRRATTRQCTSWSRSQGRCVPSEAVEHPEDEVRRRDRPETEAASTANAQRIAGKILTQRPTLPGSSCRPREGARYQATGQDARRTRAPPAWPRAGARRANPRGAASSSARRWCEAWPSACSPCLTPSPHRRRWRARTTRYRGVPGRLDALKVRTRGPQARGRAVSVKSPARTGMGRLGLFRTDPPASGGHLEVHRHATFRSQAAVALVTCLPGISGPVANATQAPQPSRRRAALPRPAGDDSDEGGDAGEDDRRQAGCGTRHRPIDGGWPRAYRTPSGGCCDRPQVASWEGQKRMVARRRVL